MNKKRVNVDDKEEIVNQEIILQDYEHDVKLTQM